MLLDTSIAYYMGFFNLLKPLLAAFSLKSKEGAILRSKRHKLKLNNDRRIPEMKMTKVTALSLCHE